MNVLVIVLNKTEYLNEILDAFVEIGLTGATIIDSQGMGSAMTEVENTDEPFYGVLKTMFDDSRPYNKTIFTVIQDEPLLEKAVTIVKEIMEDIHKPGVGIMFTVPLGNTYGMSWE
ncbi:MAG TPA: hypothetical protein VFC62_06270 [Atopostipes sp.]|nr:hypothetical protein [Atopostipes sp.]